MSDTPQANGKYSSHPRIDNLLGNIVHELRRFTEEQARHITELTAIGRALSAQRDPAVILEMILAQARRFTFADGGTLYLLSEDRRELVFHVVHNDTLKTHMGGTSGNPVTLPSVPLFTPDGRLNHANVSAHVANTSEVVNIADVYVAEGFNFEGTKKFDAALKYRSRSMLVVPMRDHEDEIIGVLQLINAKNPVTDETIRFAIDTVDMTMALASQAAVVITQHRLIRELRELFESFIRAIATAIDEKSKYTGGHISRVAALTMMIAERINQVDSGPFADVHFTPDEMDNLRIAAWMHDTGKITTPEFVVNKSKKLETVFDRLELVKARWQAMRLACRLEAAEAKLATVRYAADSRKMAQIDGQCRRRIDEMNDDLAFVARVNEGGEYLADEDLHRLRRVAQRSYGEDGTRHLLLNEDEIHNLSIRKGTLTDRERDIINNHALMTIKILEQLPWPRKMVKVPRIAGAHHEKLDGTGYPHRLAGDQVDLPSRIMAVADIFEALSAKDRPYKKPMTLSQSMNILGFMVKERHIDKDLVELFVNEKLYLDYARQFLNPSQIDMELPPPPVPSG